MTNRPTVGDMIVRQRREDLQNPNTSERFAKEIAEMFTPRSLRNEKWPPSKAELELYAKRRNAKRRKGL